VERGLGADVSSPDATAAVILAGGRGTRMRQDDPTALLTPAQAAAAGGGMKGMVPDAAGRPFLDHVLSGLADAGVTRACLVVPPEADLPRAHYAAHPPRRVRLDWVVQAEPRGTADAVLAAAAWVGDAPFLVLNADNLYPSEALRSLVTLGAPGLVAFTADGLVSAGNFEPERVAAFALLTLHPDGTLAGIVEKPADTTPDRLAEALVSMNLWRFDASILAACRAVAPSPRGELELPDAVAWAIRHGKRFRAVVLRAGVLDLSRRGDVAEVAMRLGRASIAP
jgi:dTDP-glucose pyrophosphorylase